MKVATCGKLYSEDLKTHALLCTKVINACKIEGYQVTIEVRFWPRNPETLIE